MSPGIDWDNVPFRHEDPCTHVEQFFHEQSVPAELLTKMLGGLSRQGYQDIEYESDNEPDVHQEATFLVTGWRWVCVCHAGDVDTGIQVEMPAIKRGAKAPKKKRSSKDSKDKAQ